MSYLKPEDVETPIDFEWIGSVFKTKTKKDGGEYQCWEVTVKTRADGKEHTYNVFDKSYEFGKLGTAQAGQLVRAYKKGDFVNWEVLPMGEESANIPRVSPSKQVEGERQLSASDDKQREIIISQIVHGFMEGGLAAGLDVEDAGEQAKKAYYKHSAIVSEIISEIFSTN